MNTVVALLFCIEVNFAVNVLSHRPSIVFPPKVLDADLDAIEKYYGKGDKTLPGFIHWPNSITFKVQGEETSGNQFLRIDGQFLYKNLIKTTHSYEGLYYKSGQFYVKKTNEDSLHPIPSDEDMFYEQPPMAETQRYVSIRYFGLKEMTQEIKSFFKRNKFYYNYGGIGGGEATLLVTIPNADGQFVEYSLWYKGVLPKKPDGLLRVLIGKKAMNSVQLSDNFVRSQLVYYERGQVLLVPKNLQKPIQALSNVFGIRVTEAEFLAEVRESGVRMFSSYDLNVASPLPERARELNVDDNLLKKVNSVGMGNCMNNIRMCPEGMKFQAQGIILVKSVNLLPNGIINKNCPYVIKFENGIGSFVVQGQKVQKLCAHTKKLWANQD